MITIQILSGIALGIIAVLVFELIIVFHEGGHFLTAKRSGVQVNEFSIGMGPKLFGFKRGETEYSLRLLPIGGYCAMEAEDEESDNPRAFTNAKVWKRMIIIVAGAFMNMVLGFIIMFVLVVQSASFVSTTVEAFPQQSFSANSGLQTGDKIVKANNYSILTSQDLSFAIATTKCKELSGHSLEVYKEDCCIELVTAYTELFDKNGKSDYSKKKLDKVIEIITEGCEKVHPATSKNEAKTVLDEYYTKVQNYLGNKKFTLPEIKERKTRQRYVTDFEVIRDGKTIVLKDVQLFTYLPEKDADPAVSIDFYLGTVDKNIGTVLSETGARTISLVRMVWASLVGLVSGQFSFADMSGPVGVASAVTQVASQGLETGFLDAFNNILYIMALITVNLGVFNMLPFPALDGGRFLFLLIEAIFHRPIPRKVESVVNAAGLVILLLFMAVVTLKDIWQLLPFGK